MMAWRRHFFWQNGYLRYFYLYSIPGALLLNMSLVLDSFWRCHAQPPLSNPPLNEAFFEEENMLGLAGSNPDPVCSRSLLWHGSYYYWKLIIPGCSKITFPKTYVAPKERPSWNEISFSNDGFSGAILVSGRGNSWGFSIPIFFCSQEFHVIQPSQCFGIRHDGARIFFVETLERISPEKIDGCTPVMEVEQDPITEDFLQNLWVFSLKKSHAENFPGSKTHCSKWKEPQLEPENETGRMEHLWSIDFVKNGAWEMIRLPFGAYLVRCSTPTLLRINLLGPFRIGKMGIQAAKMTAHHDQHSPDYFQG